MPSLPSEQPNVLVEHRSEEVQELLAAQAPLLLRWGGGVSLSVLVIILLATCLISYPEIVLTRLTLTAFDAPKAIVTSSEGRIVQLLAHEAMPVVAGQPLAYLESTGRHAEALRLKQVLAQAWQFTQSQHYERLPSLGLDRFQELGELQPEYQKFVQKYTQVRSAISENYYQAQRQILTGQLVDLERLSHNLEAQAILQQSDLSIAGQQFDTQRNLLEQRVISKAVFQEEQSKFIAKKLAYERMSAELIMNLSNQRAKKREVLELDNGLTVQLNNFLQDINTLQSSTNAWLQRYLVTAPTTGVVYLPRPLQEGQRVVSNQDIFYVSSHNARYIGELVISSQEAGRVQLGQTVLIKFASYPYQQYGLLKGKITSIGEIPLKNNVFHVTVALPPHLTTTTGHQLKYKSGLLATAEIITGKSRMIYKILPILRSI